MGTDGSSVDQGGRQSSQIAPEVNQSKLSMCIWSGVGYFDRSRSLPEALPDWRYDKDSQGVALGSA